MLEIIIEQIITKIKALPYNIRVFCKFLYDECVSKGRMTTL
jgi:hypothetical protein